MKKLIFLLIFIFGIQTSFALDNFDVREVCESENGVWREFGNECANNCALDRGRQRMCVPAITYACDCPEGQCWDYYQCIDKREFQARALEEEDDRIIGLKKSNPELFIDRRVGIDREINKNPKKYSANSANANKNPQKKEEAKVTSSPRKQFTSNEEYFENQIAKCVKSQGLWKEFPNGCADTCFNKKHPGLCSSKKTQSCKCPDSKCWDGKACVVF